MSTKSQVEKIEDRVFLNKENGGVDREIFDQQLALTEGLNRLIADFDERKRGLWFQVFGEEPKETGYQEVIEEARLLTEQYGDFSALIEAHRGRNAFNSLSPEKQKLFREIWTD